MTQPTTDDLTDLEREILALKEDVEHVDIPTAAATADVPHDEAAAALEALEHEGYVESLPVVYEFAEAADA